MDRRAGRGLVSVVLILLAVGTVLLLVSGNNPFATGGTVALTTSTISPNGSSATPRASAAASRSTSTSGPVKTTPPGQAKKPTPAPTPTPTPPPAPTPTPVPAGNLTTQPVNSSSAQILWTLPGNAARVQIFRNGRLIDDFPFPGGAAMVYTDYLLWQSTSYAYEVKLLDAGNAVVADQTSSVTTPAQAGSFTRLYASTSFWNTPIPAGPAIDPNSAAMITASLSNYAGSANFAPTNDWGKAIAFANAVSRLYTVGCTLYDCGTVI